MLIHFTTVHSRTDTRVRVKQVATLARHFEDQISLYVQDGLGDEQGEGYRIVDVGAIEGGRITRVFAGGYHMFLAVLRARPRIAHFHDPELVPWAMLLRLFGIKVIYDVHEDIPRQLQHKDYISAPVARLLAPIVSLMEWLGSKVFSQVVVVVPSMIDRFSGTGTTLLANFPSLKEFPPLAAHPAKHDYAAFVYVGAIADARGISEMVDAIGLIEDERASIHLLGTFSDPKLEADVKSRESWRRVQFHGWGNRETVVMELSKACAGLVLLHPTPQYVISYPVKMFEYMAAGLPVIASDFPLWRQIVEDAECGLLVDPTDPAAIADAMQWILDHPAEARQMGIRGRAAVESLYNWEAESEKLLSLYSRLLA